MSAPPGNLFVIAAPSGGGKTSLTRALLERERGIRLSVSYTTRPPRPGEQDGVGGSLCVAQGCRRIPGTCPRARQLVRNFGDLAQVTGKRRPGRVTGDRLAGCGASACPDSAIGAHFHPSAIARSARGKAHAPGTGRCGHHRATAGCRAGGNSPLRGVQLCYY